jgi:uncharacterized membrane protein
MWHAGEQLIGARAYRVIFAFASLPLAIAAIVYFINHRYDGVPLWDFRWARVLQMVYIHVVYIHLVYISCGVHLMWCTPPRRLYKELGVQQGSLRF